ncbi:MAG: AAA family ATPase [Gammaproteobacteria bacterium]
MSDKHSMALTLLEYSLMNHTGFTVISGEIGTGKTTLIRHVLNHMDRDHTVGLISTTHRSFGELLQWILLAFNLDHANMSKVEMYQCFINFIINEYAHNRSTILIVDEAQNLSVEVLEELRMLSNINADKDQALQIILVGQRELRETLQRPELAQFAQRISVDFHLQPLSEDETITYIRHRLHTAGGDPDIFDLPACQTVYHYSGGVPRLINVLCDTALVYGYAEQEQRIDARLVTDVAHEKQQGGIFPTLGSAAQDTKLQTDTRGDVAAPAEDPEAQAEALTELEDQPAAHNFTRVEEHHAPAVAADEIELPAAATGRETAPAEDPEVQAEALTELEDQPATDSFTMDEEHHTPAAAAEEIELPAAATGRETAPAEGRKVQAEALTEFEDQLAADSFTMDEEHQPAEELDSFDTPPAKDMLHEGEPEPDTHSEIDFGPVEVELLMDDKTYRSEHRAANRKVRLALCSAHEGLRKYLSKIMENHGIDVVMSTPLDLEHITTIDPEKFDVLLIDRGEDTRTYSPDLENILDQWPGPLIYNNTEAMKTALRQRNYEFGKSLAKRIEVIAEASGARLDL